jgi:hypothetical protein
MKASLVLVIMLAGCGAHPGSRLSRAVDGGNISQIQELLAVGASGAEINDALVWAARIGNTAAIPPLANAGANVDGTSGVNGWTVLMHAIHKGQDESVKALLGAGADPNRLGDPGGTPLTMAAGYGYSGIVKTLLDQGADPAAEGALGLTALDFAVTGVSDIDRWTVGHCQTDTVRVLLEKAPELTAQDTIWRRIAGRFGSCPEVQKMLNETRAAVTTGRKPPTQHRM